MNAKRGYPTGWPDWVAKTLTAFYSGRPLIFKIHQNRPYILTNYWRAKTQHLYAVPSTNLQFLIKGRGMEPRGLGEAKISDKSIVVMQKS